VFAPIYKPKRTPTGYIFHISLSRKSIRRMQYSPCTAGSRNQSLGQVIWTCTPQISRGSGPQIPPLLRSAPSASTVQFHYRLGGCYTLRLRCNNFAITIVFARPTKNRNDPLMAVPELSSHEPGACRILLHIPMIPPTSPTCSILSNNEALTAMTMFCKLPR
jgi:hypothetical protein